VTIELSVPQTAHVEVAIYDIAGRLVRSLYRGELTPGVHEQEWNGMDNRGRRLATIYLARAQIADVTITRKLVLAQ
jgi:flagellar hook assembly protein FlgD